MVDIRSIDLKPESFVALVNKEYKILGVSKGKLEVMETNTWAEMVGVQVWVIKGDKPIPDIVFNQRYLGKTLVGMYYCHVFVEEKNLHV